ncbi:MAG: hypothetical protein IH969_09135, partial [Candidatus Krumholzibacteriota bacterium]|nr:hypothetical protein [Candidatus Krumholzibacteriota bacterium]
MTFPKLAVMAMVVAGLVFAAESVLQSGSGGSLLLSMVFWLAVAEGCVALMAAAEVTHASWHRPLLTRMLSAHAMIPVIGVMFLVFISQLDIYPWNDGHGRWFTRPLFVGRHLVLILAVFLCARKFAADTLRNVPSKRRWGVIYLVLFMTHQTFVGIEWVMSLEKPWISTLFGAWFMVSSFLSGICLGAILLHAWRQRFDERLRYALDRSIVSAMNGERRVPAVLFKAPCVALECEGCTERLRLGMPVGE